MIIYEPTLSGWNGDKSFGLFGSKEQAIKCLHEEAKKLNAYQKRIWSEDDEQDMISVNTLHWNGDRYISEMETLYLCEREVLL